MMSNANTGSWLKLATLTALISSASFAAPSTPEAVSTTPPSQTVATAPVNVDEQGKVTALIDIRPEVQLVKGGNDFGQSENSIDLGYQFDKNNYVGLHHEYNTNIGDKGDVTAGDFILRAKINNIWEDRNAGLSFSYEPRLYMPTRESFREAGGITTIRNYFKLKQDLGGGHALTLMEIPIAHIFNRPGNVVAGVPKSNAGFENRVYLVYEYAFNDKLSLSIPLMLNSSKGREFGGPSSTDWNHVVWAWPELDYAIDKTLTVGIAYQTDNLIKPDMSDTALDTGLGSGIVQAVLMVNL